MSRLIERAIVVENTFYGVHPDVEWFFNGQLNDILDDALEIRGDGGWDIFHIHDSRCNSLKGSPDILDFSGGGVELL